MARWAIPGRRRALLYVLGLLLAGAAAWAAFGRTAPRWDTVLLARGDVEDNVTALGTLQPRRYVDVGAQVSGQIRRIAVQPGDRVGQGASLVDIDPSVQQAEVDAGRAALASLRAQLADQQAQFDLAAQQHARQQQLAAGDATRDEDRQIAHAAWRSARARLDQLRAQIDQTQSTLKGNEVRLGYTRIFAPMAGTVVSLEAREGQTLNATYQTPNLLRIADLGTMTVWTEVSEADVHRVKPGMAVYFTTLGIDGRRWQGRVRQLLPAPPATAAQNGTTPATAGSKVVSYTVLFDVDNRDGDLMPQMTAQVFFVAGRARNVVLAPVAALEAVAGKPGAWRARVLDADDRVVVREVRLGVRDRFKAEVRSGLQAGERLITGERTTPSGPPRFSL
ncbi:MAG: efflux RND transporter periplasmic adaptor subunit [Microvirgula sp.]